MCIRDSKNTKKLIWGDFLLAIRHIMYSHTALKLCFIHFFENGMSCIVNYWIFMCSRTVCNFIPCSKIIWSAPFIVEIHTHIHCGNCTDTVITKIINSLIFLISQMKGLLLFKTNHIIGNPRRSHFFCLQVKKSASDRRWTNLYY